MSQPPCYRVITVNNLIKVNLEGYWNPTTDMAYISELSEAMRTLRNQPWALVVDMRGWVVTDEMRNFKSKTIVHMDRRNQKLECWIVDDMQQGDHVLHYIEKANIPFKRCLGIPEARTWLGKFGFLL